MNSIDELRRIDHSIRDLETSEVHFLSGFLARIAVFEGVGFSVVLGADRFLVLLQFCLTPLLLLLAVDQNLPFQVMQIGIDSFLFVPDFLLCLLVVFALPDLHLLSLPSIVCLFLLLGCFQVIHHLPSLLHKYPLALFLNLFVVFFPLFGLIQDGHVLDINFPFSLFLQLQLPGLLGQSLLFKQGSVLRLLLCLMVGGLRVKYVIIGVFCQFVLLLLLPLLFFDCYLPFDVPQPVLLQQFLTMRLSCYLF